MTTTRSATALVPTPALAPITNSTDYAARIAQFQGQCNVLTPFTSFSGLAPSHALVFSFVTINPDTSKGGAGEVYDGLPFIAKGKQAALAKIGLRKLAELAGISWRTIRLDSGAIPNYWYFKAICSYRGIDGAVVSREATFEWDLRDGSARLKGWTTDSQISEGRKNGLRNCEARAINAAIRECGCGIKQVYSLDELKKPFLVVKCSYVPDMSIPEIRMAVHTQGMQAAGTLGYPEPQSSGGGHVHDSFGDDIDQPKQIGRGIAEAPSHPAPTPATTQAETPREDTGQAAGAGAPVSTDPPEGSVRIVDVTSKDGKSKEGKPWTRYVITDSHGAMHSTFDSKIADAAKEFKASGAWVEIQEEQDGQYQKIVEISVPQPRIPGLRPEDM